MFAIDASFLLDVDRKVPEAVQLLNSLMGEDVILPFQTALEYLVSTDDPVSGLAGLESSYRIIHSSNEFLLEATALFERAMRSGRRPSWSDLQVAAVAALHHRDIITANGDVFEAMGLRTKLYRPPSARGKGRSQSV